MQRGVACRYGWGARRRASIAWMTMAICCGSASMSVAFGQMPGAPVLQNAWASPGLVAAINYAGGADGSTYAGAVAWAPASARLQLSGGIGVRSRTGASTKSAYGLRAALPLGGAASGIGFGAFAGIGGGANEKAVSADSTASTTEIPFGASIGWRRAIGTGSGFSIYATPSYVYFSGGSKSGGLVRAAIGLDVGVTRSIGATGGIEFGQSRARGLGGPSGTLYGIGLSYAFGRR